MKDTLEAISRRIYKYMSKNNRSITATSGLWGISRNELSAILNCKNDVKLSTLAKIADGIGCPVSCLMSQEEDKRHDIDDVIVKMYTNLKEYLQKDGAAHE